MPTPAWRVERLETGHVMVVLTDGVWGRRDDGAAKRHLLGDR